MSENIELQLKLQALEITVAHQKDLLNQTEKNSQLAIESLEKSTNLAEQNSLAILKSSQEDINNLHAHIKDINLRLSKNFLTFENLGKRLLFLASLFGALQILIKFVSGFLK